MRPLIFAARVVMATCLLAPTTATAQDPEPPSPAPHDVAVPRARSPQPSQRQQDQPSAAAQERRGSVRAPDRAAEPPARVESDSTAREPRHTATSDTNAVPRSAPTAPTATVTNEEQGGDRPGAVRRPTSDAGSPSRDRAVVRRDPPPSTNGGGGHDYPYRYPYYPNYARYYDPWGYGSFGLGYFYYAPWVWAPYPAYGYYSGTAYDIGRVRLKVQPRDAEVWVDGYYAGTVDDFDGMFQSLRLDTGAYHIEVRKPGFETLTFDVRVQPDRTITFRGTMRQGP